MTRFTIVEEIDFELEAIAEQNASPIYDGIKNADLLGKARAEIKKLYTDVALLADENEWLYRVIQQGFAMIAAQQAARNNASAETIRAARIAEEDFGAAVRAVLITKGLA